MRPRELFGDGPDASAGDLGDPADGMAAEVPQEDDLAFGLAESHDQPQKLLFFVVQSAVSLIRRRLSDGVERNVRPFPVGNIQCASANDLHQPRAKRIRSEERRGGKD